MTANVKTVVAGGGGTLIERLAITFRNPTVRVRTLHAATVLFLLGIFLPIFSLKKLGIFTDTHSIVTGAFAALAEGELFLFVALVVFSMLFPGYKIVCLYRAHFATDEGKRRRVVRLLERVGRWSMLDVFVVAVLVASLKTTMMASIEVHAGLYCFGASVLLTMMITLGLQKSAMSESARSSSI